MNRWPFWVRPFVFLQARMNCEEKGHNESVNTAYYGIIKLLWHYWSYLMLAFITKVQGLLWWRMLTPFKTKVWFCSSSGVRHVVVFRVINTIARCIVRKVNETNCCFHVHKSFLCRDKDVMGLLCLFYVSSLIYLSHLSSFKLAQVLMGGFTKPAWTCRLTLLRVYLHGGLVHLPT